MDETNAFHSFTQYLSCETAVRIICAAVLVIYFTSGRKRGDVLLEKRHDETLLRQRLRDYKPESLLARWNQKQADNSVLKDCIDLVRMDFLSLSQDKQVLKNAAETIKVYGVGTCGPRSFLGTTELHLELEQTLPKLLNFDAALCYPYGSMTAYSVIGVCIFNNHTVFIDEYCDKWIKQALQSRRCKTFQFKHNDPEDLTTLLTTLYENDRLTTHDTTFLILEGVYSCNGKICNYKEFIEVARKFKLRVMIDESYSFGVLGKSGLGISEYFGVDLSKDVDVMFANIEGTLGAIGGFSVAHQITVDRQYIFSPGFVYSASLPAYLTQGILTGLDLMAGRVKSLQTFSKNINEKLGFLEEYFTVLSDPEVPLKFVVPVGVKKMHMDNLLEKINKLFKEEFKIFVLKEETGLRFNLNYKLAKDDVARDVIFSAFVKAVELVKQYQRY